MSCSPIGGFTRCYAHGNDVLITAILSLTTAVLAPVVCLATVLLLPFSDRLTQATLLGTWTSYLALAGVVLL